ncbi:LYR motif-containing protein 2 isoform X2 [Centrocercus urophasianus]|uniref:LYR motif-containing protein 2 isoform X2 n=1 Tax=Centrocercus urophasianus TaxID=9002 RepID=UPI001C653F2F|nr:LYR motif-containing protein 2 isoform X2 [Centrocercus urophasianus]
MAASRLPPSALTLRQWETDGEGRALCWKQMAAARCGKGAGVVGQCVAEHEAAVCPGGQEDQQQPGLYQEMVQPAGAGK